MNRQMLGNNQIKVFIEEVNTSVNPPVAQVRDVSNGGAMRVYLATGSSGSWITPNVGEIWWIQFLGTRWTLLSREDSGRGAPGTSDYVQLTFQIAEQSTELAYKGIVNFNSAAVNASNYEISHYIINWIACNAEGVVSDSTKANQFVWYPNVPTDGADSVVDPNPDDSFDYVAVLPGNIDNPKTTFYKARIRAVAKNGSLGNWTEWTNPILPTSQSYYLPPAVEDVSLGFQVFEIDSNSLQYNAVVKFQDVGYWDLPGGDFSDDLDRYEVQVQPFERNTTTYGALASAITASATAITLSSGASSPAVNSYISIEQEVMKVAAVNGTTWTVVRAQQSTNAATHSANRAVKQYVIDNTETEVAISELITVPVDELGALEQIQSVLDIDEDNNWPLLGTLKLASSSDFISPSTASLAIELSNPEHLANISNNNISQGIYLQVDSEKMKITGISSIVNNVCTVTVERGALSTQSDNHTSGVNIYLQSWIPIFKLSNPVKIDDTKIQVIFFDTNNLTSNFNIKLEDEVLRVIKKTYKSTNSSQQKIYELDVYRGIQNTAAQAHSVVNGSYYIGAYYTNVFTAIPGPDKYWWSARVRAVDRFNRKGPWSDWTTPYKASTYSGSGGALPPAPTSVAMRFKRNYRDREWSGICEVAFDGVVYEIPGGDTSSDVLRYQARLFHSDGAYLVSSIAANGTALTVYEPDRGNTSLRQLAPSGTGYIFVASGSSYEIMRVTASSRIGSSNNWTYNVTRGALNTDPQSFTVSNNNPIYIFYFPPQEQTKDVSNSDLAAQFGSNSVTRYTTSFSPINKQWWYIAQVRTIDKYNRSGAWSAPSSPGTASDTTRPPAPFNLNVMPYDNNTIKIDWDAPLEPGLSVPVDIASLLQSGSQLNTNDFNILSKDISYFKVQLWSEDPHGEIPENAKSFGLQSVSQSGSSITFTVDTQPRTVKVTSAKLQNNLVTLTTNSAHGIKPGKTFSVSGIDSIFNGTSLTATATTFHSISYAKTHADVTQFACDGDITFIEGLTDWFNSQQSIYIDNCSPEIVNGQQTITTINDSQFTINLSSTASTVSVNIDATIRPFEAAQALDYYETYPIHYFTRLTYSTSPTSNLTTCLTAVSGDVCLVTGDNQEINNGYWKLTGSNPTLLSSWTKIVNDDITIPNLIFNDDYVSTTSRVISLDNLSHKVWARIASVDNSGNTSVWVSAGPFFTKDVLKPQNVILDFNDPVSTTEEFIVEGGSPSSTSGDFNTTDLELGSSPTQVTADNVDLNSLSYVNGLALQWNEVIDPDLYATAYEVEVQGARMFAQLWEDNLTYWGTTVSEDVVYGGLTAELNSTATTFSVIEFGTVPAPEFYISIDDEIMYVENIVRDWNDENQPFVQAIYSVKKANGVRQAQLGTIARSHGAAARIVKVQVEPIKVLEFQTPNALSNPFSPFSIIIGNEKLTVLKRTAISPSDTDYNPNGYSNLYWYECLRDRRNGQNITDFEHDGINNRIALFDSITYETDIVPSNSDFTDQDDIVSVSFNVTNNQAFYRGHVRSILTDGSAGSWSDWTFWADPQDVFNPLTPTLTANLNETDLTVDLSWTDGYADVYTNVPTIFNSIASTTLMTQLPANAGDTAVVAETVNGLTTLKAYILLFNNPQDINNWKRTLVPLRNMGTSSESVLGVGDSRSIGAFETTDYYEVQVSRVPKAGKSVNSEGSVGVLLEPLYDGTSANNPWTLTVDPLKVLPKYPEVGDQLQIVGNNPIASTVLVNGTSSQNEIQKISLSQAIMSGSWKLQVGSAISGNLSYDASPEAVRLELAKLGSVVSIGTVGINYTNDTATLNSHGFVNNDIISFNSVPSGSNLVANSTYYAVNVTENTFQIATAPSSSALNLTGSSATAATISRVSVTKPSLGVWNFKFLTNGPQPLIQAISSSLNVGYDTTSETVTIVAPLPSEADWATSRVTLYVERSESGTSFHPIGSTVKWIDITAGDFLNDYSPSFEYIYLWKHDPLFLFNSISYSLDDIGDYLYAARVRAKDAAGNASNWAEVIIRPDGLPIPEIINLEFTQIENTSQTLDALLTFQSDVSPEYNITHFVPELMPALRTQLLNEINITDNQIIVPASSGIPDPQDPTLASSIGIGAFYAFIDDEVLIITQRTPIVWTRTGVDAYQLTVQRAKLNSQSAAHSIGSYVQWFYQPTIKQIEYGISYSGAITTANVEPGTGTLISDNMAEFVAPFDGVVQPGVWYQGRAKAMAGTVSSSWSNWSHPLRALDSLSLDTRAPQTPLAPLLPNPVRSLIVDVDARKVNVSWLPPLPRVAEPTNNSNVSLESLNIGTINEYIGSSLPAVEGYKYFQVTTVTIDETNGTSSPVAHNFYVAGTYQATKLDSFSLPYTNSVFLYASHGFLDGDWVTVNNAGSSGLSTSSTYYIVNSTLDSFQISSSTAGTAINLNGTASVTLTIKSPSVTTTADEVTISGAYSPFDGTFSVVAVPLSPTDASSKPSSFIIQVDWEDGEPTTYPIDGSNNDAVVTLAPNDLQPPSEVDHYIVAIKPAKKKTIGGVLKIVPASIKELKNGTVKWSPPLRRDANCKETFRVFKLGRPTGELPYYARVFAVNSAGQKSEPRYARGFKLKPPKPRITGIKIVPAKIGDKYTAKIGIDLDKVITDKDVTKFQVIYFTTKNKDIDPATKDHHQSKTVLRPTVEAKKKILIKNLKKGRFLFVKIAAIDADGVTGQWTYWRRKKIKTQKT